MGENRQLQGRALAWLGGAGVLASLWLPWWSVRIRGITLDLGPHQSDAELSRRLGALHMTFSQFFTFTPAFLLAVCAVGASFVLTWRLRDRANSAPAWIGWLGGLVAAIMIFRLEIRPVPNSDIRPAWGLYLAVIGTGLMLVGGLVFAAAGEPAEARASLTPDPWRPNAATDPWGASRSVPPPKS